MPRLFLSILASALLLSCSTHVVSLGFLVEGDPPLTAEEAESLYGKFQGAIETAGIPLHRGDEVNRPNTLSYSVTAFAGGTGPSDDWVDVMSISYPGGSSFLIYVDRIASGRREFSHSFIRYLTQNMELLCTEIASQKVVVRSIALP